jgi:hypothetical protein
VILVDTSVWVGFFKGSSEASFVADMIRANTAFLHPLVYGELLLGGISGENESLLRALSCIEPSSTDRIYRFIKNNSLPGRGVGWVDAAILCSIHTMDVELATFDQTLRSYAETLGVPCCAKG